MSGKSKRVFPFGVIAAGLVGLGGSVSHATLQISEDFPTVGTTDTDLNGTPASTVGLTGNWFNTSSATTPYFTQSATGGGVNGPAGINRTVSESENGTALVYPTNSSLAAPTGGTALFPSAVGGYGNAFYQANLATPIPFSGTAGNYYFSYLLDNSSNSDYDAQIAFGGASTQVYAGFGYGAKSAVSVQANGTTPFGGGNSYNATGGSFASGFSGGNLGLVVGELTTTASGADTIGVKIFRYTAGGAAAALPTSASGLTFDASYNFSSSDTATQLGIFLAGQTNPEIDAIRVGSTYADVVGNVAGPTLNGGPFTTYTGAVNGSFDTSTQNFSFSGSPVAFANGNSVLFDNSATGTHNVVVAAGGVSPSAVTFNSSNATAAYSFTGGPITATGALTLVNNGTVTLGNANTYSGGVNLSNGSLVLGTGGTLSTTNFTPGGGSLNFNGGTLQALGSSTVFISGTPVSVSAGGGTIDTQGFNVTLGESISGSASSTGGGITKIGTGNLTLTGISNYKGTTTVNGGTLTLATGGGGGAVQGPLTINSGATVNATSTDALGYTVGFQVPTLTVNSGGTFILGAGNEGYTTNLVVNGGTVSATAGGSFNLNTGYNISSGASPTTGTISADVQVRGASLTITTAAGTSPSGVDLAITGRILGNPSAPLTINGPGTTLLSGTTTAGTSTYGGGTTINGGTVVAASPAAFGPTVDNLGVQLTGGAKLVLGSLSAPSATVALSEDLTYSGGGGLQLAPTPSFSSGAVNTVNVTDAGTVKLTSSSSPAAGVTHGVLVTQAVNFSSTTSGALDVGNNDLDIQAQSLATVSAMVASGYQGGAFNGPGINSSVAASDTAHLHALGVIANDNGSGHALYGSGGSIAATFDGSTPNDGDTLVKYTYYGDTNLDGVVNAADYSRVDAGFVGGLTGWYNGDFNYDGKVDGSDYTLIDNAFNQQTGTIPSLVVASATAELASPSAVPEPATLGLAAVGAVALLGRRRRRLAAR